MKRYGKTMNNTVSDIFYSRAKTRIDFKGDAIKEAVNFGFSYIESKDHVVNYIVVNSKNLKSILVEVPDSKVKIGVDEGSIGELWTAKLLVSDKLLDSEVLFSNETFSAVINLNLNSKE